MAICNIPQTRVYNSDIYNDELDISNALSASTLEEDLNYIRSILRELHGGTSWNDPGDSISELTDRVLTAGDGLTGGGDLSADRTFAVDNTVVRTSGDQTIDGAKTFVGELIIPAK